MIRRHQNGPNSTRRAVLSALLAVLAAACLSGCLPWSDYDRSDADIMAVGQALERDCPADLMETALLGAGVWRANMAQEIHARVLLAIDAMDPPTLPDPFHHSLGTRIRIVTGVSVSDSDAVQALLVVGLRAHQ